MDASECKPGLWAELENGWIVGPIVKTEYAAFGVYVQCGDGTWQLDVDGGNPVRSIKRVGTREHLAAQRGEEPPDFSSKQEQSK